MAAQGSIVFDGLAITTVEADTLNKTLSARAAFVDSKTGETHGWTEAQGTVWSEKTKAALAALITSMEQDMGRLHFASIPAAPVPDAGSRSEPGGLGEHLQDHDAPSV